MGVECRMFFTFKEKFKIQKNSLHQIFVNYREKHNYFHSKMVRNLIIILDTREKNEAFGSSLLLANSPMSPKIVNGSFAAIFDADEFLAKTYAGIRIAVNSISFHIKKLLSLIDSLDVFFIENRVKTLQQCVAEYVAYLCLVCMTRLLHVYHL